MFNRVLLPLDGSSVAECAVPHTSALVNAFDARLMLLRVLEGSRQKSPQPVDPLHWRMYRAEARSYLDHMIAEVGKTGVQVQVEPFLLDGDPAQHIVKVANDYGVDLIALSSHGQGGLSSWNHGGVIRKVIARARTSVMIVRAYRETDTNGSTGGYKRIMLPLDGSRRAECVLPPAVAIARHFGARLLLVHVVARPEMARYTVPTRTEIDLADGIVERNQVEITKLLEQLQARLAVSSEIRIIANDHVAEKLHELANQEKPDLVMLSAHGHSGKTRWPYGGVAASFIEYGVTPLLVIQDLPSGTIALSEAEMIARERKGH